MQKIKSLKGKRWFIWAIVVVVAGLGGLATYIYSASISDQAQVSADVTSANKVMVSSIPVKLPVSQEEAINLVKNLSEVKAFAGRVTASHGQLHVVSSDQINKE